MRHTCPALQPREILSTSKPASRRNPVSVAPASSNRARIGAGAVQIRDVNHNDTAVDVIANAHLGRKRRELFRESDKVAFWKGCTGALVAGRRIRPSVASTRPRSSWCASRGVCGECAPWDSRHRGWLALPRNGCRRHANAWSPGMPASCERPAHAPTRARICRARGRTDSRPPPQLSDTTVSPRGLIRQA